ncbi:hypothetical protein [Streptomyces variegatus]|uniref:hypothetical protein n=1 Tax=Streptomyces variegatus TaxID=284040 RepID=UPI003C2BAEDF
MPDHIVDTSAGPVTVTATEPVPGLHVYEIPAEVSTDSPFRWILAHHEGPALASFETEAAATTGAAKVAPLVDWTRNAMTTANLIGPGGMQELLSLLRDAGGQHPNA